MVGSAIDAGVLVALGTGGGAFGATTPVAGVSSTNHVRAADFDADGNLDIVVTSQGSGVGVALRSATGTFSPFTAVDAGNAPERRSPLLRSDVVCANIAGNNAGILHGD